MQSRTVRRALVVIAAYLLSFVGGFPFMAMGAYAILFNDPWGIVKLIPFIWLFAWVAHAKMSIAWVKDQPLSRRWPLWGTVAGVVSLLSPLVGAVGETSELVGHRIEAGLIAGALVGMFLLPCILLAIYLVRFHWHADAAHDNTLD